MINRGLLKLRAMLPSTLTARALLVRARARRELARLFEQVDVLAWPTLPAVAPPLADPLVELPSGTSADAGNARPGRARQPGRHPGNQRAGRPQTRACPSALQLLGAWGSDALLLDAAEALERATDREFVELRRPRRRQSV